MPQTATIKSLPAAFRMMKAMRAEGVEWGEDYRSAARQALAELLEGRMGQLIIGTSSAWPSSAKLTGATATIAATC